MKKILLFTLLLVQFGCTGNSHNPPTEKKVLLISFDGFRADYLEKTQTPNFDNLTENGVRSEGLIPVFPSKTFPNHYALATGLYPENNGIIGNSMYDPVMDAYFSIGDRDAVENADWYEGEPIWNTVEKQGKNAGTMFWVGSEAPIQDMRPTHWKSYDGRMPDSTRIDSVVKWMSLGNEKEIDLGTLYFSFLDNRGHRYGPDSQEVTEAIKRADDLVGYLSKRLQETGLHENTHVLIVSDHGMSALSRDRIIVLDDYIDPADMEIISGSPVVMAKVKEGKLQQVYEALKKGEEHYRVYKKEDIPERYHIKDHHRTPELVMVAEEGYTINTRTVFEARPNYPSGGTHGFDPQAAEMHALFVAWGPEFREGVTIEKIESVDIYALIAHILDIEPADHDGSFARISKVLK